MNRLCFNASLVMAGIFATGREGPAYASTLDGFAAEPWVKSHTTRAERTVKSRKITTPTPRLRAPRDFAD